MISVFRVYSSATAPRATFAEQSASLAADIDLFDGRPKGGLSPRAPFHIVGASVVPRDCFVHLAPGVLLIDAWRLAECSDMYYVLAGGVEHLRVVEGEREFTAINPLEFLPPPSRGGSPCIVDKFYMPLFRISGMPPTHVFTATGFLGLEDELKSAYEMHGFKGLTFELVWSGPAQ